jgi:hypothetical protein
METRVSMGNYGMSCSMGKSFSRSWRPKLSSNSGVRSPTPADYIVPWGITGPRSTHSNSTGGSNTGVGHHYDIIIGKFVKLMAQQARVLRREVQEQLLP